jgi:hypothetical protein
MPNEFIIRNGFISKGNSLVEGSLTATTISATNLTVTGGTGTNWFSGNTSNDLLRVTQTGSGNAFVVEDESNPDNSPFVIKSGGNVGIGTTSPTSALDVRGGLRVGVDSTNGFIGFNRTDGFYLNVAQIINSGFLQFGGANVGAMSFNSTSNEWARFTGAGNLLIGTTGDTGQRLQVSGDTLINGALSGITTSGVNWFSGNTSTDLLRVTQTGSGNAFVVEDESNPDNSPFVITSGGSVGIGTTSPTQRLQVSGNTLIDGILTARNVTNNSSITLDTGFNPYIGLGQSNNSTSYLTIQAILNNNYIDTKSRDFYIKGNNSLFGGIFQSSGNVVIQTATGNTLTDNGFKLDIAGTARVQQLLTLTTGLTSTGGLITSQTATNSGRMSLLNLRNTGGGYTSALNSSLAIAFTNRDTSNVWSDDFIELKVYDSGTTTSRTGYNFYTHNNQLFNNPSVLAMSINGQNVGIGNENPSERLDVSGNTLINGGLTTNTISAGTYQNIQLSSVNNLETSLNNKFDKSGGTVSGDVFINGNVTILGTATTINTETLSVKDNLITLNSNATGNTSPLLINSGVEILRNSATTASLIWNEQNTRWEAGLTGSTKQIILSGDSLSLLNSGHTHPISEIINLQTSLDSKLDKSGGVISGSLVVTGGTGTNWFSGNTSSDMLRVTQTGSGNAFVVEDDTNPDSSPFVVTSTGNIGIGTTNPTERLQVSGTSRFDNDVTIWDDGVFNGNSRKLSFRGLGQTGNTQTGEILLDAFGGTNKEYLVLSAGGVRLNTNDADGTIQINNTASSIPKIQSIQSGGLAFEVNSTTNGFIFGQGYQQTTGDLFSIYNYGPTKVFSILASNSNVGIGTATPSEKLDVNGNTIINGALSGFTTSGVNWFSGNTNNDMLRVTQTGSGNAFVVEDSSNPDSSPFVITSGGSVGIGTTSPSATLSVSGNSATTSTLLVQSSTGGTSLQITNNNRTTIGTDQVSPASLYIGHNGSSGGNNGTETVFFSSQFEGIYPYRFGAEGNGYNFFLRQVNGGQGNINIDFSSLNRLTYAITDTNIISQSYSGTSIIRTKSSAGSYLGIGNIIGLSTSASSGDTPLVIFRSMNGQFFDKTLDSALTIRNGLPTVADDNITKNTAHWYRNGYIGIGTSTVTSATNNLKGALTINQGTNIGYINTSANTQSSVITTGVSNIVNFTPNNGNGVIGYNIVIGTIITANGISRTVTGITYNTVSVDSPVDWSAGYNYTYRNPYISIADGTSPIFDISPSGNVGIGTTTPREKLDVSGNTIVSGTLSGGTMVITTQPTSGYTTTQILMRNSTTGQVEITDRTSPSIYNYGMSYAMSTFNYST